MSTMIIFHNDIEIMSCGEDIPIFPDIPEGELVIAKLPDDAGNYDPLYEYEAVEVDGEIIARNTGELKYVDPVEEQRKWDEGQLTKYRDQRASADGGYPDIGDQLDDLFHKGVFSDEMTAEIQAIKDKYPKPE